MKKGVFKNLIGAFVIAIIVLCGGWQYLSTKREEYKQQLENTINDKYLEGENAIGAFYYNNPVHKDSINIQKVSSFTFDQLSWMLIKTVSCWNGTYFDNTEIITKMMLSGRYKWYDFSNCPTTFGPFMIIVKRTNRGYDIIGEYIIGIGLTNSYPDYLITHESSKHKNPFLSNKESVYNSYKIKPNMINFYFEYLKNNKYKGITIRSEVTRDQDLLEKNIKFDMLNSLVMKGACPQDSSLYFRVNKYFELKFDNDFIDMGTHPIIWETSSYGNDAYTVFTRTVTMHYSIQENMGVLELEYKKKIIFTLLLLEAFYFLVLIVNYRLKRLKLK